MVAAMIERTTAPVVAYEYRDQYCTTCHGHLGVTRSVPGLPRGTVWHRVRCHSSKCRGKERMVDLAGGVARPMHRGDVLES